FFLISFATCLRADDVSDYAAKVESLVYSHHSAANRLLPTADATLKRLTAGTHLYVADAPSPAFANEAGGRPGGLACIRKLNTAVVKSGDVVWMSYDGASYAAVKARSAQFLARGGVT